ncbi:ABC transporter permease [Kamptonema sp. UHCC 0994]|uniref:ABC transporter permease n=1 Tax=Kamptonema sp. UHCC 0994 TaxID=3031329 RepID=UPI0023B88F06|nr:ABC transporter permease [Kamptonema sp. UHCC 0994]MDF0551921.1 ABC transporter permease [Kamptonema sp. UHCC 0994]
MVTKINAQIAQLKWRPQYIYDLLRQLVSRDMKLLYKRSVLGIAWTLIAPLLQLAVFTFVFNIVIPMNVPQYSSYVFIGLLVWNWFSTSLFQATGLILQNRALIRLPKFPSAILPVVTVMTGMIHFLLALPVLTLFLLIDGVHFKPVVLFLPILMLLQFALTVGIAYPLAAFNVTFHDTQHTLGVLLQMLLYLTPIFYQVNSLPPKIAFFYYLNPMVSIVQSYRAVLIYGTQPNLAALGIIALISGGLILIGHRIFDTASDRFVEEI